jgi:hypothetical protein
MMNPWSTKRGYQKMKRIVLPALAFVIMSTGAAIASDRCTTPMNEWQPREALQSKLEADGWKVKRIKIDDGCYEAYAIDADGRKVEAYFDPKTFEPIKTKREG